MENDGPMVWSEQPDPAKMQEFQRKMMEQQSANETELKRALGEVSSELSGFRTDHRLRGPVGKEGILGLTAIGRKLLQLRHQLRHRFAAKAVARRVECL